MNWDFDIEEYEYGNKRTILIVSYSSYYYVGFLEYNNFILKNDDYCFPFNLFNPIIILDESLTKKIHCTRYGTKSTLTELKEKYNVLIVGIDITFDDIKNNPEYYTDLCSEKL